MTPKTFFIIQGPVVTFGQGPNNQPYGFTALETILENIRRISAVESPYIVCTWKPKNEREVSVHNELVKQKINLLVIDEPAVYDPDHRFKHHYAIMKAMESNRDKSVSSYCKIRTDQLIPEQCFQQLLDRGDDKLLVSELMRDNPLYIGDFIYSARCEVFERFINLQLKEGVLHPSIGQDIGLKFMLGDNPQFSLIKDYLFDFTDISACWADFAAIHLLTLSKHSWCDITWRGRRIGDFLNAENFCFNPAELGNIKSGRLTVCRRLIGDYSRLAKKRGRVSLWFFADYMLMIAERITSISYIKKRFCKIFSFGRK